MTCPTASAIVEEYRVQLGFVSAILPEFSLEEVLAFAADAGFDCVEVVDNLWIVDGNAQCRMARSKHAQR